MEPLNVFLKVSNFKFLLFKHLSCLLNFTLCSLFITFKELNSFLILSGLPFTISNYFLRNVLGLNHILQLLLCQLEPTLQILFLRIEVNYHISIFKNWMRLRSNKIRDFSIYAKQCKVTIQVNTDHLSCLVYEEKESFFITLLLLVCPWIISTNSTSFINIRTQHCCCERVVLLICEVPPIFVIFLP